MKDVVSLVFIIAIIWFTWSIFFSVDYSKPWWNGNEYQRVCATTGSENCYDVIVSSDGKNISGISMPNGGYIQGYSSECVKASQLKDARLCRMWDSKNVKWDIMKG